MTYGYDDQNRRISTTNAAGETSTTTFDDAGNVLTSTNPRGNVMTYTYDLRNRVTQVADSLGVISQTTYDNAGRRITQTDGNGNTITFTYDAAGRMLSSTDALGHASTQSYDAVGNVTSIQDRESRITTHTYDALNRRVATTDALGNTTSYAFNAVGNLTSITDARGNITSYTYDNLNRRITETYPDAAPNTKTFTYDAVGNILTRTDQKGQVQTHVYDDLYRLLSRSTPGWAADTFTYDVGGRMLTATRGTWVVTYAYDVANRVTQTTQGGRTIGYAYDVANGTRTITYPGGRVITEQQDLRSRLSGVKEGAVNIATYTYDNGNRVDTRTYNNGVVADYTYDANNRITLLEHSRASVSLAAFAHAYDNEGNKRYEEQQHNPTRSEGYQYDSIYRLVDYKVGTLVAGTVPVPTTQTAYNLDAVGNWDSKTKDSVTENRTHNAANEITAIDTQAISHDDNGNLIQDANYDYTFDENNRLIQVNSPQSIVISQYSYDALGRRISKDVSGTITVFLYDNARIIEERDGSNNVQATYTYGNYIDEVLTKDAGANRYYYHQNTLWSIHALTDAAGAVVERYTYDAYGALSVLDPLFVPLSSAPMAYFTFTGREYDGETGIYHYRARSFDSLKGRFLSRDPLGYVDGMSLYEYVGGKPSRGVDPLGLCKVTASGIRYRVDIASLDAHQKQPGYSILVKARIIPGLRETLHFAQYQLTLPEIASAGPIQAPSPALDDAPAGAVVGVHYLYFIDWEIDETDGPCEIKASESQKVEQDGLAPVLKQRDRSYQQLPSIKVDRKVPINGCDKTLIFADAPGGPAYIQGKFPAGGRGFKTTVDQTVTVYNAKAPGIPVHTVTHTVVIGMSKTGELVSSP